MRTVVALLRAGGNFELTKATARNFKQLAALLGPAWNLLQFFSFREKGFTFNLAVKPFETLRCDLEWEDSSNHLLCGDSKASLICYCTVLHWNILTCALLHCTALKYIDQHFTASHCKVLNAVNLIALQCSALYNMLYFKCAPCTIIHITVLKLQQCVSSEVHSLHCCCAGKHFIALYWTDDALLDQFHFISALTFTLCWMIIQLQGSQKLFTLGKGAKKKGEKTNKCFTNSFMYVCVAGNGEMLVFFSFFSPTIV